MDISKCFYKKCFDYYLKLVFFKSLLHTPSQFFVKEKLVRVYVGVCLILQKEVSSGYTITTLWPFAILLLRGLTP